MSANFRVHQQGTTSMTGHYTAQQIHIKRRDFLKSAGRGAAAFLFLGAAGRSLRAGGRDKTARRNIVFVLSDDHRYDFMGFMEDSPAFLQTPNMDRMARQGAHLANAFVSTSLCSPSRASILTGQYMHHHRIADNQRPEPKVRSPHHWYRPLPWRQPGNRSPGP